MFALYVMTHKIGTVTCMLKILREENNINLQNKLKKAYLHNFMNMGDRN